MPQVGLPQFAGHLQTGNFLWESEIARLGFEVLLFCLGFEHLAFFGLGFEVLGLGFKVLCLGCKVLGVGFEVLGSGSEVLYII